MIRISIVLMTIVVPLIQASIGICQTIDYTYTTIDFPSADETAVYGINNLGHMVGEYGNIDFSGTLIPGNKGFMYDGDQYETIDVPNSVYTIAEGINDLGYIVGEYLTFGGKVRGFLYDGSTYSDIITPWSDEAVATDINNDGVIVGTFSSDGFQNDAHGFIYDGTTYTEFNYPGSSITFMTGINDMNQKVGTFASGIQAGGFILPSFAQIQHPEGLVTDVSDINNNGIVAGRYAAFIPPFNARFEGFTCDSNSMDYYEIDLPGSDDCSFYVGETPTQCIRSIKGINSKGTIVGWFDNSDGVFHGFIGTLPSSDSADFDSDLDVDGADFLVWQCGYGISSGAMQEEGDANLDGAVDDDDLLIWSQQFGSWEGNGGAMVAIPEPGSIIALLVVIAGSFIRVLLPESKLIGRDC